VYLNLDCDHGCNVVEGAYGGIQIGVTDSCNVEVRVGMQLLCIVVFVVIDTELNIVFTWAICTAAHWAQVITVAISFF
jgi:hypothetical protein